MSVKKLRTTIFNGKEVLKQLMNDREMSNRRMAKILGVEPWTIGAWLSGKREISSKYEEKIKELYMLPSDADLLLMPVANELAKRIREVDDADDLNGVLLAFNKVIAQIGDKLCEFAPHQMDTSSLNSISRFIKALDEYSLARVNNCLSAHILGKAYINSLTNTEFGNILQQYLNSHKLSDIHVEMDGGVVRFNCYYDFYEEDERRNHPQGDEEEPISEEQLREYFEEDAFSVYEKLFGLTGFEEDSLNHQWVSDETYMRSYTISLDRDDLKESIVQVLNRHLPGDFVAEFQQSMTSKEC